MSLLTVSMSPVWKGRFHRWMDRPWLGPLLVFGLFWPVYLACGAFRSTPYVAHVWLAEAFLSGRFYLLDGPHYFELVRVGARGFLPYGIGPSVLMMPGVLAYGRAFPQGPFSAAVGAAAVACWWIAVRRMDVSVAARYWLLALLGLGTPFCFYSGMLGSTWPLQHVTTTLGVMIAIAEGVGRRRGWVMALGLALAVATRMTMILTLPFFLWLLVRPRPTFAPEAERPLQRFGGFAVVLGAAIAFLGYYNWARFGSVTESGLNKFVLTNDHPVHGVFSLQYAAGHLRSYLFRLPATTAEFPYVEPTLDGFSIFIGVPALFIAFAADWRDHLNQLAALMVVGLLSVYIVYYWSGFLQFSHRYFLDALPFALVLIASGTRRVGLPALRRATLLGMLVEVWGIVWWRVHGL